MPLTQKEALTKFIISLNNILKMSVLDLIFSGGYVLLQRGKLESDNINLFDTITTILFINLYSLVNLVSLSLCIEIIGVPFLSFIRPRYTTIYVILLYMIPSLLMTLAYLYQKRYVQILSLVFNSHIQRKKSKYAMILYIFFTFVFLCITSVLYSRSIL